MSWNQIVNQPQPTPKPFAPYTPNLGGGGNKPKTGGSLNNFSSGGGGKSNKRVTLNGSGPGISPQSIMDWLGGINPAAAANITSLINELNRTPASPTYTPPGQALGNAGAKAVTFSPDIEADAALEVNPYNPLSMAKTFQYNMEGALNPKAVGYGGNFNQMVNQVGAPGNNKPVSFSDMFTGSGTKQGTFGEFLAWDRLMTEEYLNNLYAPKTPVYYGGGYGGGYGRGGGGGRRNSSPYDFFFNLLNWRI